MEEERIEELICRLAQIVRDSMLMTDYADFGARDLILIKLNKLIREVGGE